MPIDAPPDPRDTIPAPPWFIPEPPIPLPPRLPELPGFEYHPI